MTDGTSQGLFIVVAIVIFGIFTLMAYILFEDTLSPALATMFTEATEESHKRLVRSYLIYDWDLSDANFEEIFVGRETTIVELDKSTLYNGGPTVKATFNGLGHQTSMAHDLVLWLDNKHNNVLEEYKKVHVTFYAKSDIETDIDFRLGGIFFDSKLEIQDIPVETLNLTKDWVRYDMTMTSDVDRAFTTKEPAIVFWTTEESNVWFSNIQVKAIRED